MIAGTVSIYKGKRFSFFRIKKQHHDLFPLSFLRLMSVRAFTSSVFGLVIFLSNSSRNMSGSSFLSLTVWAVVVVVVVVVVGLFLSFSLIHTNLEESPFLPAQHTHSHA